MHVCSHERTELRWRIPGQMAGRQCLDCGRAVRTNGGLWVPHSALPSKDLPFWSDEYDPPAASESQQIQLRGIEDRSSRFIDRDEYQKYLLSEAWRRRRAKVMTRANNLCEGCLMNAPSEVHHLTYAHITEEFAFELVALCDRCHDRVHETEDKRAGLDK